MKKIIKKWCSINLIFRILMGIVLGAVLAIAVPSATPIATLGTLFVGALKAIAPLLVFILVLCSIANASKGLGSRFFMVICLYMFSTLVAAIIAVVGSYAFPVTIVLSNAATSTPPGGIGEVINSLFVNIVANPISALSEGNYIGVLFWAILLGIALKTLAKPSTLQLLQDFSDAVSKTVRYIIQFAPFGILGLVFSTVSENGLEIFTTYGSLLLLLVSCMLIQALIFNPILLGITMKKNPYPLVFTCIKESGLTAFFTRSSAANIPVNMALCEKLGLDKDFYSVCIPLGATINMDGAAITITVMTLAVAHTLGMSVDIPSAIILSIVATLAACGSSGIAGGSLLLIPMACSLFGISGDIAMQAVGVGFIIGVVQDSLETALNSSGDVMFAAAADYYDKRKKEKLQENVK